jgi:hypothetical protein
VRLVKAPMNNTPYITTYNWQHTTTKTRGRDKFSSPISKYAALSLMNTWNRTGNGDWLYWIDEV